MLRWRVQVRASASRQARPCEHVVLHIACVNLCSSVTVTIHQPRLQGRLTLLLGPPSSGKSMLMKTIAGQMEPSKALRVRRHTLVLPYAAWHGNWSCWHAPCTHQHASSIILVPFFQKSPASATAAARRWAARCATTASCRLSLTCSARPPMWTRWVGIGCLVGG